MTNTPTDYTQLVTDTKRFSCVCVSATQTTSNRFSLNQFHACKQGLSEAYAGYNCSNSQASPLLAAFRIFIVQIIDGNIQTCPHISNCMYSFMQITKYELRSVGHGLYLEQNFYGLRLIPLPQWIIFAVYQAILANQIEIILSHIFDYY